jgi:hypothetical protein
VLVVASGRRCRCRRPDEKNLKRRGWMKMKMKMRYERRRRRTGMKSANEWRNSYGLLLLRPSFV